ncbi:MULTISPECIES: type II toxin-antitoxin system ParD family antitoxin [unclassified Nostoc]|uniref:type II toxin-antitoxin system ParD family antitoxin n=1 Tax=unclassified Nostoc TaxID=2593658 RepID=UPI002AD44C7A|nr:type II toxin-antitoxin system ParD family antitoxin [Nostoc sp. DedQUE03]MDZ7973389.1 type II toxin-antitoxin system ParD family antitoxin [Nostoc sp. DedQUE03]MDZ8045336.1 type II toxin-antitoxin system ParD family antitoxin [Nostoc sp. DedQUE02]
MNVSLTPELEQLVKDKVNSGRYHSVSEVMGEALRLLDERARVQEQRLAELKAKIQEGLEASERGEVIDGEEVFAEIEEDIRRAEAQMQQAEAAK